MPGTSLPAALAIIVTPDQPKASVTIQLKNSAGSNINNTSSITGQLKRGSDVVGAVNAGVVQSNGGVTLTLTPLLFKDPPTSLSLQDKTNATNTWEIPLTAYIPGENIQLLADPSVLNTTIDTKGTSTVTFKTQVLDTMAMGTAYNITLAPFADGGDGNMNMQFLTSHVTAASGNTTYSLASAAVPSEALRNPSNSTPAYLTAELTIQGKDMAQTNPYKTQALAFLGDLLAPRFNLYPGTKSTLNEIDFTTYAESGFPWFIPRIFNAYEGQTVVLWADSDNYPSADGAPYVLGTVPPLDQQTKNQNIVIYSPVDSPVFQHASDTLTLYYSATRFNAPPTEEPAYSDKIKITLNRPNFTQPYSELLRPPVTDIYNYTKKNYDRKDTLKVRIDFKGEYKPNAKDIINVTLDLIGYIDNVNKNIHNKISLKPYPLTSDDIKDGVVLDFPNVAANRDGYTYTKFAGVDGSAGNLYYTVTPFNGTTYGDPILSPPVYIQVDVIDPFSGISAVREALGKRNRG